MTILFEKEDNVARIVLNRPDVHNAFNEQMIGDLSAAFLDLENCTTTDVVILSGAGASFSAGADLMWMKQAADFSFERNVEDAKKLSDMLNLFYELKQLTIVCAKGANMGGAIGLISCADIAIADHDSKFSLSEVKLGLIPATISPFVIKAIGARQAKRFFQTAEKFNADKALEIGLIHEISTSNDDLNGFLESLFFQTASNGSRAMKEAKKLIIDYQNLVINDELRSDTALRIAKARSSEEAKEGIKAFFDKRKPSWSSDV